MAETSTQKMIRLLAQNENEQGIFGNAKDAFGKIGFDDSGNFILGKGIAEQLTELRLKYYGINGQPTAAHNGKDNQTPVQLRGGWGGDFNSKPTPKADPNDPTTYMNAKDLALHNQLVEQQKMISSFMSGDQHKSAFEDEDVQNVFKDQKPMTWQEYFAKTQEGYSAQLSDGTNISGRAVFPYMSKNQAVEFIDKVDRDYSAYLGEYKTAATNFIGNKNLEMQQAQAKNDTDPSKRNEVANYGSSPVGASGWGRNSIQSSESFNDVRRRTWGQDTIQGV